jgi:hypothetical protein
MMKKPAASESRMMSISFIGGSSLLEREYARGLADAVPVMSCAASRPSPLQDFLAVVMVTNFSVKIFLVSGFQVSSSVLSVSPF